MQLTDIQIQPQYGSRVTVLPIPADPGFLRRASREQLALLIALMEGGDFSYFALAEKSGATRDQIDEALRYWEQAGVLTVSRTERAVQPQPKAESQAAPVLERAAQLPHYNTDETARFLETHPSTAALIECCQQELGKVFNTAESEIIIGMADYLSLGMEYILLLCAYCAKKGHKSLRYIEKTAISFHDAGIVSYEQLELHLKRLDLAYDAEQTLRQMFGIGQRALSKKEKEAFFRWTAEWELPTDVIAHAYEITVNRTKEPSVPYTNAILDKWHATGLTTLAAVEAAENAKKSQAVESSLSVGSSFDTDEFLDLAIARSYGGKK